MGLKIDQNTNYFLIISFFFIVLYTIYSKEENKVMKDNCLSIQSEGVFWSTNEYPSHLSYFLSNHEEVQMFDAELKKNECLSNSMLFIHLALNSGIARLHYYTWDSDMIVYHISFIWSGHDTVLNTEVIKKDMRTFEEMIGLLGSENIFTDVFETLADGSEVYLVIKKNQKIKRYATYDFVQGLPYNFTANDYVKYIKAILEKNRKNNS